jgi:oxepin-CoA hydrolase/3-oxo-5,6-dehydrosuberyl-CoA semialdehyde dehydrogenase
MVDILDRDTIFKMLNPLKVDALPVFGAMTAQHMVEHLILTVRFSNGKEPQRHHFSREKEEKIKAYVIGTDKEMPIGFKSPVLPIEGFLPLVCSSLSSAKDRLRVELKDFDLHFANNPLDKPINPTMGQLNYQEWVIFHNRHFTHHYHQFKLLL